MRLQILSGNDIHLQNTLFDVGNFDGKGLPRYYNVLEKHFSELGISVEVKNLDKIDLTKPWLVNVIVQGWTFYSFTGNILDSFDDNIKEGILNGNAFLILNHESESHTTKFFETLYKHLSRSNVPFKKIIYLCNAFQVDQHYQNFIKNNNIIFEEKINTIYSPHAFYNFFADLSFFNYEDKTVKSKKFLCLNRVARGHRLMLLSLLSYYDLFDYGFISLGHVNDNDTTWLDRDDALKIGYEKIKNRIPMILDTDNFELNRDGYASLPVNYYQDSYFSLVTATYALKEEEVAISTNEKEYKPMLAKQPFIICGRPKTLQYLNQMGFMTFSKWFDESYDNEFDDNERIHMIAKEVKRLCDLSDNDWMGMLKEMQPILLHNYFTLINYASVRSYFNADLKKLLYYVS